MTQQPLPAPPFRLAYFCRRLSGTQRRQFNAIFFARFYFLVGLIKNMSEAGGKKALTPGVCQYRTRSAVKNERPAGGRRASGGFARPGDGRHAVQ